MTRSEHEVDEIIAKMIERSKGSYITQGVSFNKTCPRQMALLKKALMLSVSFSGLAKEMLATRFEDKLEHKLVHEVQRQRMSPSIPVERQEIKNVGNFL